MADLNDIRDEFSPLLDDELSADARHTVEAELAQDSDLLRELDALRKVDELYRGLPRVSAPDDMAARVREQLHPKPKVLPLRTRRLSRTVYTSFAAAAVFAVLIGGLVLRRDLFVSSTAQDRFETAARMPDEVEMIVAEQKAPEILGTAAANEPSLESDGLAERQIDSLELRRDQAQPAPPPPPMQQEGSVRAAATGFNAPSPETAPMDDRAADEAKEEPAASAVTAPPPAPVVASSERVSVMPEEAEAPMAGGIDADMADVAESVEMRQRLAKKSTNPITRIADHEFEERDGGWYERGYDGESLQTVRRGSETLNELASSIPKLSEILALKGDIVFKHSKTWYRVPAETP